MKKKLCYRFLYNDHRKWKEAHSTEYPIQLAIMNKTSLFAIFAIISIACFINSVESACICPAIYQPVCGSNLVTYSNACQLGCDVLRGIVNLYVLYQGECDSVELI